jgi:hypothetical protein
MSRASNLLIAKRKALSLAMKRSEMSNLQGEYMEAFRQKSKLSLVSAKGGEEIFSGA